MQIFVTSECPAECAQRLWKGSPKRAIKMITETQQILACAQKKLFGEVTLLKVDGTPFKTPKSRMNHPVVKWASDIIDHMYWLTRHLLFLYAGYKSNGFTSGFANVLDNISKLFIQIDVRPIVDSVLDYCNFAKADSKGLDFTHIEDVFEAYDLFLKAQGA